MRTKILIITTFLGFTAVLSAQLSFGVKTGLGYTGMKTHVSNDQYQLSHLSKKNRFGFLVGGVARQDLGNYFVELSAEYMSKGSVEISNNANQVDTENFTYLNLPFVFGRRFFPGIRIYAGLGIEIPFYKDWGKDAFDFLDEIYYDQPQWDIDVLPNFLFGSSIEFSKVTLGITYYGSFSYEEAEGQTLMVNVPLSDNT